MFELLRFLESPTVAIGTLIVLSAIVGTVLRQTPRLGACLLAILSLAIAASHLLALASPAMPLGGALHEEFPWIPELGFMVSFHVDSLSRVFVLLISGIGVAIYLYAQSYLATHHHLARLLCILGVFQSAMLGLVCADNFYLLFVFWEITSFTSYLLISFKHNSDDARRAALQALLVTGSGGLALLAGLALIHIHTGHTAFSTLQAEHILSMPQGVLFSVFILILVGCFTKSAQFPFHFWLPGAMTAPSPVSAYLHSATMVKAGVYLLARLNPSFSTYPWWSPSLLAFGGVTFILAACLALFASDLKRILALTTVASLGTLVMLLGIGGDAAYLAFGVFLLAHALYKAPLFLLAGNLEAQTGKRTVSELSGLRRSLPLTAVASFLAVFSLAGVPPFLGFLAKELAYTASLSTEVLLLVAPVTFFASACILAAGFMVGIKPFLGTVISRSSDPIRESPPGMWAPALVLALCGLFLGSFPQILEPLLQGLVSELSRNPNYQIHLSLFHGLTLELALSLGTLLFAALLVWLKLKTNVFRTRTQRTALPAETLVRAVLDVAQFQFHLIQSGYLRRYFLWILITTMTLVAWIVIRGGGALPSISITDVSAYGIILSLVLITSCIFACRSRTVLLSVACLGMIGAVIALFFVLFGAPDLAITQFVVEALTVILLVLLLNKLPDFKERSTKYAEFRDITVSILFGTMMGLFVLWSGEIQIGASQAAWFVENSIPFGFGRNVTNVIIVDFRALDTLGEITVLAVAGIGVFALLDPRSKTKERL